MNMLPFEKSWKVDWDNRPDYIDTETCIIRVFLNGFPRVGDKILIFEQEVVITSINPILDYWKHNWELVVRGKDLRELKETLTYKL